MATTNEDLIERAKDLAPGIKARAAETERLRRPHDDTIRELIEAEIIQMLVPRKWGGPESDLRTMLEVVEIISGACISTGWNASFYINHQIYIAKLGEKAQHEVFGPRGFTLLPAANAPTMTARKVDGGWVVSGRAQWGSGIMHADWVLVTGTHDGGSRVFLLPFADVRVDDVWHFAGMAGTGSNDIVLDGAFVPDYRTAEDGDFKSGPTGPSLAHDNPLYSLPILPLAYATVTGVITGGLKGMFGEFAELVEKRVRNFSGTVVKDQQHTHIVLGEARIARDMAGDLARLAIGKTQALANRQPASLAERLNLKARLAFNSRLCLETANMMMACAGASSFHLDKPIQRYWRDLNTVCSHAFWDWDATRELMGRDELGLKPNHPLA